MPASSSKQHSRFIEPPSSSSGPSNNQPTTSASTSSQSTTTSNGGASSKNIPVFEFTKRKRWADLLVTELSEAIILVLSPTGKIWYCGAAVAELLGWKDEDVVDREFTEYVNHDDVGPFQSTFQRSIHHRSELLTYARLRCKPTAASLTQDFQASAKSPVKEVLFELKGYPHFVPDAGAVAECKCFFIMAKPYPSRNTAMLNTFLELKMENQRLEERVAHLRSLAEAKDSSPTSTPVTATSTHTFPATSFPPTSSSFPLTQQSPQSGFGNMAALPEPTSFYSGSYEELLPSPGTVRFENMFAGQQGRTQVQTQPPPQSASTAEDDEASAKKKLKKTYGLEQYVCVTCGRTDSPEWRKGPNGPKTLCNACGLRWAKTVKTKRDAANAANTAAASGSGIGGGGADV
ncbi:blue light receptor [Steccherinum ochraceum]|uniref:Blue light receptor n=1 Tax=Steccherinum ochraceum TaxID=92696 RepID=A0A4R0S184_9APHY|nr:blue light receptor [Steccherinum ochraceum]